MKSFFTIISILAILKTSVSQNNLVIDPSFEDFKRCPQYVSHSRSEFQLKKWYQVTAGTIDYYNSCGNGKGAASSWTVCVPKNQSGFQYARTGNGYVGFLSARLGNEREYLGSELKEPLVSGQEYYVEFWVSLADYSLNGISKIGAYLSKDKIASPKLKPLKYEPQIVSNEAILDTANWVKISGTYIAEGNEKFITIGSFASNGKYLVKTGRKIAPKSRYAYYYIDDVVVKTVNEEKITPKKSNSELNKKIVLKNITFEYGKSELKESSFVELDQLVKELKYNLNYKINLLGHTDNIGKEEDNLKLSESRAKAVADYLISKGITETRITYKGYGVSQPITTNETDEGREKNRRVEFVLTDN